METQPGGSHEGGGFQTPGNPLNGGSVGSFGISEGNISQRKTHTHADYMPNHNSQRRRSLDAPVCQQRMRAEQGGLGCMLRVRTGPECPEDNLRELTWNSNPNCGREKERERSFPRKALRHNLACSQNKGLNEYQRRVSQLWTGPSTRRRQRGRRATARARRWEAILAPEMASSTKLWAGSQLLTKTSWELDSGHPPGESQ